MQKNIVILGAGFGGLQAALRLSKKLERDDLNEKYSVVLVDKNLFHTFTPLLYEIAATSPETANNLKLQKLVSFPIQSLISNKNITFVNDEISGVDMERKKIQFSHSEIDFEYLVIAPGAEVNYFGIPGLQKYALTMKSFADALRIRDALAAALQNDRTANVIVGGGGATGVELAGEIEEWAPRAHVIVIDGAPTILNGFSQKVIKKVTERLKKLGIETITNEIIGEVTEHNAVLKSGKQIPYDIFIWAGGVKASSLAGKFSLKLDKRGRIETEPTLKCAANVYAIGDVSSFVDPKTNNPVPQVARAAIEEGKIAAKNIINDILKNTRIEIYKPWNYPYIVPVGGKYAVAKIGPLVISGLPAWIFKGFTELNYFVSIMPIWEALKIWFKGLKIFIKNHG